MSSTARTRQLDMARFNEAFMMHTSTSPQYGIIASCDVAAAMMEQPAGRALVQETIDEALSFRRAMTAAKKQLKGSWWFDVWQPDAMAEKPVGRHGRLDPEAGRQVARLRGSGGESCAGRSDQGDDSHARPVGRRHHAEATASRRRSWSASCRRGGSRSRRPGSIRSWFCSRWASPRASGARWSPSC